MSASGGEGQIQSELMESMRSKIQTALDAESVSVTDVAGDGRHVEIGTGFLSSAVGELERPRPMVQSLTYPRAFLSLSLFSVPVVVSNAFEGQTSVNRQRMVYVQRDTVGRRRTL